MGICEETKERTKLVKCSNENEHWQIELATYQLKSHIEYQPDGFTNDTGVVVAGGNIGPGRTESQDPCVAVKAPIWATRAIASAVCSYKGRSETLNWDRPAREGKYFINFRFGLKPGAGFDSLPEISFDFDEGDLPS